MSEAEREVSSLDLARPEQDAAPADRMITSAPLRSIRIVIDGERFETHGRGAAKTFKPIPWVHESINVWVSKRGPWVRQKLHDEWGSKIAEVCAGQRGIRGPVIVTVWSFIGADRDCDPDNKAPKFIMDGLVDAGMIDGDGRRTVVDLRTRIRVDRANPRTEIEIRTPTGAELIDLGLDDLVAAEAWKPLRKAARQLGFEV